MENKKLISGKQCKIETGAHHKNCTLAGLTLSHFHITTNDQYVPFLLDQLQVILKHYKFIAYNNPKQSLFGPKGIVRQEFKGTIPMWEMVQAPRKDGLKMTPPHFWETQTPLAYVVDILKECIRLPVFTKWKSLLWF